MTKYLAHKLFWGPGIGVHILAGSPYTSVSLYRNNQSLKGAVVVTLCQIEADVKMSNGH